MISITQILKQIEGFKNLNDQLYEQISSASKILSYKIGYKISTPEIISENILIILEGEARLIGSNQGVKSTILKLRPGQIIGLSSILRAEGCENVTASENIVPLTFLYEYIFSVTSNTFGTYGFNDLDLIALFLIKLVSIQNFKTFLKAFLNGVILQICEPM